MIATKMARSAHGFSSIGDDWRDGAACNLATAHLFDVDTTRTANPSLTAENHRALALCRRCPVDKQACLDNALTNHPNMWVIAAGQLVYNGQVVPVTHRPPSAPRHPDLRAEVANLHHRGRTPQAIAALTGAALSTVRKYVREAQQAAL